MSGAIIIGAGLGGLALGIRLQAAGVETTILEARAEPGGRSAPLVTDGFTFDDGIGAFGDPASLAELWGLSGRDMADDLPLLPVTPFWRFYWPDGTSFDFSNDDPRLIGEIARFNPEDVAGYRDFLDYLGALGTEAAARRAPAAHLELATLVKSVPALAKHEAWRSVWSILGKFVKNGRLREVLAFQLFLIGGNPMRTSALYTLAQKLERDSGLWYPKGGGARLIAELVAQFERLGGTLRSGDAVVSVETLGDRVTGVRTASGWQAEAAMVASNADAIHSYRDLLRTSRSAQRTATRLLRKRWSPSLVSVHFAIKGAWPGIAHQSVLLNARFKGLIADIFDSGVLPQDLAFILRHPTVTDPALAKEGHSIFSATALVPNLGKLPVEWQQIGPIIEQQILKEIERRLIPDLANRIIVKAMTTPGDLAAEFHAHLGSAFSLEPSMTQSAYFRVHNRDAHIENLYFVGAATHPGAGLPGALASAKATAALMLEARS